MFQGATQLNLDSKNRLTIPSKHRDLLLNECAGNLVLTADASGCLLMYPQPAWLPIRDKLLSLNAFDKTIRAYQRLMVGRAEDVLMDGAGRVLISPTLRSYAAIDKLVMLVGLGNKFELWDEAKYLAQEDAGMTLMGGELPTGMEGFAL